MYNKRDILFNKRDIYFSKRDTANGILFACPLTQQEQKWQNISLFWQSHFGNLNTQYILHIFLAETNSNDRIDSKSDKVVQ